MPQTLLALLALALSSYIALNQQHASLRSQRVIIGDEVTLAATGLASEVMASVEARSFDELSTPEKIHAAQEVPSSPGSFSLPSTFGTSSCTLSVTDWDLCGDDVDDAHRGRWLPVSLPLAHGQTLDFEVRLVVYYVDTPEAMAPSASRTLHKRVVIDVRSPHIEGDDDGLVRLTRVVSYDPIKAEKDYELVYGPLGVTSP